MPVERVDVAATVRLVNKMSVRSPVPAGEVLEAAGAVLGWWGDSSARVDG